MIFLLKRSLDLATPPAPPSSARVSRHWKIHITDKKKNRGKLKEKKIVHQSVFCGLERFYFRICGFFPPCLFQAETILKTPW
jgi:hypothetical protein